MWFNLLVFEHNLSNTNSPQEFSSCLVNSWIDLSWEFNHGDYLRVFTSYLCYVPIYFPMKVLNITTKIWERDSTLFYTRARKFVCKLEGQFWPLELIFGLTMGDFKLGFNLILGRFLVMEKKYMIISTLENLK